MALLVFNGSTSSFQVESVGSNPTLVQYNLFSEHQTLCFSGCSLIGLKHQLVTLAIVGSNPITPVLLKIDVFSASWDFMF